VIRGLRGCVFAPEGGWRGQLMRLTVSMTGKKWLNGSVAHEPSRRGDSVVRVSRKVLPFSRRTIR
jgi:hypothetical protein